MTSIMRLMAERDELLLKVADLQLELTKREDKGKELYRALNDIIEWADVDNFEFDDDDWLYLEVNAEKAMDGWRNG